MVLLSNCCIHSSPPSPLVIPPFPFPPALSTSPFHSFSLQPSRPTPHLTLISWIPLLAATSKSKLSLRDTLSLPFPVPLPLSSLSPLPFSWSPHLTLISRVPLLVSPGKSKLILRYTLSSTITGVFYPSLSPSPFPLPLPASPYPHLTLISRIPLLAAAGKSKLSLRDTLSTTVTRVLCKEMEKRYLYSVEKIQKFGKVLFFFWVVYLCMKFQVCRSMWVWKKKSKVKPI